MSDRQDEFKRLIADAARRGPRVWLMLMWAFARRIGGDRDALARYRARRTAYRTRVPWGRRWRNRGRDRVFRGDWSPPTRGTRPLAPIPGRVLHLVGQSLPYTQAGYTVRTQYSVEAQAAAGIDAQVMTRFGFPRSQGQRPSGTAEDVNGVRHHRLGRRRGPRRLDFHLTAGTRAAANLVADLRPALLHAHSDFRNALVGAALSDLYGLPLVYEVRGFWEETWVSLRSRRSHDDDVYRWRRDREVEAMHRADHVITLAATMVDRIVGDGVDRSKITIVPNAVDPLLFPYREEPNLTVRRGIGVPDTAPLIGYISNLSKYEGIETLITATGHLRAAGIPVHCMIVGDGDEFDRLVGLARQNGLEEVIHFTGRVPHSDVLAHYEALDVFVIPRRDDEVARLVQPLKPYEALSVGIPLVVSDLPALRLIVDESGAGMTFTAGDATSLADAVGRILSDPEQAREWGRRGADHVRRHHTWAANARRYTEIYARLGAL